MALGKVGSRPPRRQGLPSRGAELDSSTPPPASRGGWVLRGRASPPDRGGRTWGETGRAVGVGVGGWVEAGGLRSVVGFGVCGLGVLGCVIYVGRCVWCGGSVAVVSRGFVGEVGV